MTTPGIAIEPAAGGSSPDSARDTALQWLTSHPTYLAVTNRLPLRAPVLLLVGALLVWAAWFAVHVHWRHDRFGTFDHDLAIWDQAVWLLAHGESLITVRGLDVFGFHASPALYLYVPFYWLGAGPTFLTLSMVAMFGLGSIATFRLARHHLHNEWHALVLALAFLVNYAGQWMLHETFHPEVMAITPLIFAYLAAVEGRWRALAGWLVFALAWKEDVALAGMMLGVVLVIRGTRTVTGVPGHERTRRIGAYTVAACAAWFIVATQLLIPAFSSEGNFTEGLYGDLGASPTEVAETIVTEPDLAVEHLDNSRPTRYLLDLGGSFGFAPFASPLTLLIALPQMAINLFAIYDFFWTTKVHYAAIPLAAFAIAAVEGVARARAMGMRRFFLGVVAIGAFYTSLMWGLSPMGPSYDVGFWPITPSPIQADLEAAVTAPDGSDAVSATYNLVPHMSHRSEIYTFPNPWIPTNWGVRGENRPDPDNVDWLILEPNFLNEFDQGVLVAALTDPGTLLEPGEQPPPPGVTTYGSLADPDEWEVLVDRADLLIAKRVR
jgi:uncharacterized membrane protein